MTERPIEEIVEQTEDVVESITEPVADAADAVGEATRTMLSDLAEAVRINSEVTSGNRDAINRIERQLGDLTNAWTSAGAGVGTAVVQTGESVGEAAASVPEASVESVEAVVDPPKAEPIVKRRGLLGKQRKGRR